MDVIEMCDNQSKNLLQCVENAVSDLAVQLTSATEGSRIGEGKSPDTPAALNEDAFRQRLVGFDARSSTPKRRMEMPGKLGSKPSDSQCESRHSVKSKDSDGIWSLDSKPIAMVSSREESTTVDFHLVEAVLPKRATSLQALKDPTATDAEDDELSDGSQSHTVYNIAKLVTNLNAEKKRNSLLEERIQSLEIELEAAKAKFELEVAKIKEADTSHVANLVEEIYAAQKQRESAVLARLKTAIQDRDEALLRAKAMSKDARWSSQDRNNNAPNDASLQQLLDAACEADTGRAIDKYGQDITSRIKMLKNERNRITSEEMKAVISERDDALRSCRALRRELRSLSEQMSGEHDHCLHKFETQEAKKQLRTAEKERDRALAKVSALEEEMETLRVYYSLHKTLAENGRLGMESEQNDDATRLSHALRVADEHTHVQEVNARRHEADAKKLREKNERLERLVDVLRKKLVLLAQKSAQSVVDASKPAARKTST